MDTKKILSWISLLLGEILIVATFILFKGNIANNILFLNILISTIIFLLLFIDILRPLIDLSDKSQKEIGSIGIRWIVSGLYSIFSIAGMIICNLFFEISFTSQLIVHGVLIFLLLLGIVAAINSSDKVKEVFIIENLNKNGIIEMKNAITGLTNKMNQTSELPDYFTSRINTLEENIRFISPSNIQEAFDLESSFVKIINDITYAISEFSMNEVTIESNLKKCERIFQNRKQIHSN